MKLIDCRKFKLKGKNWRKQARKASALLHSRVILADPEDQGEILNVAAKLTKMAEYGGGVMSPSMLKSASMNVRHCYTLLTVIPEPNSSDTTKVLTRIGGKKWKKMIRGLKSSTLIPPKGKRYGFVHSDIISYGGYVNRNVINRLNEYFSVEQYETEYLKFHKQVLLAVHSDFYARYESPLDCAEEILTNLADTGITDLTLCVEMPQRAPVHANFLYFWVVITPLHGRLPKVDAWEILE